MHETLNCLAGLLIALAGLHRLRGAWQARPLISVSNTRRLLFGGLMLSGGLYWVINFLKVQML
jgi:hypothetical protein